MSTIPNSEEPPIASSDKDSTISIHSTLHQTTYQPSTHHPPSHRPSTMIQTNLHKFLPNTTARNNNYPSRPNKLHRHQNRHHRTSPTLLPTIHENTVLTLNTIDTHRLFAYHSTNIMTNPYHKTGPVRQQHQTAQQTTPQFQLQRVSTRHRTQNYTNSQQETRSRSYHQTFLRKIDPTNTPWGDLLLPKQSDVFRIYFQNVNSISAHHNFQEAQEIGISLSSHEIELFGLAETNLDWKQKRRYMHVKSI